MTAFHIQARASGLHVSGTKYYELVLLQEVDSLGNTVGPKKMIRRYGKVSVGTVGGASMIQDSDYSEFQTLKTAKIRSGYAFKEEFWANSRLDQFDKSGGVLHAVPKTTAVSHYRNTSQFAEIATFMKGVTPASNAPFVTDEDRAMAAPAKAAAPPPPAPKPIIRPENWGSW